MQNDFNLVPGMILQHFKRETADLSVNPNAYLYEFIGFGVHSETNEPLAIYRALYNSEDFSVTVGNICCRPYSMFLSEVDKNKYPDVKQKFRFEPFYYNITTSTSIKNTGELEKK